MIENVWSFPPIGKALPRTRSALAVCAIRRRRGAAEASGESGPRAEREVGIFTGRFVDRDVAVLRERGQRGVQFRCREVLADAPARSEPERQQRSMLFGGGSVVSGRIEPRRVWPGSGVAVDAAR
jgi:hypothetical protein